MLSLLLFSFVVYCLLSSLFILFYNQYCGEGTLEEASRGGQLPELMIRRYSRDTLLGISYLHENGIAHRDIKVGTGFTKYSFGESVFRNCLVFAKSKFIFSTTNVSFQGANIFLTRGGRIKLGDFGCSAKLQSHTTQPGEFNR